MALDYFAEMGGERVFAPERVVFALDHYARHGPTAELHRRMREFATAQGIRVWEAGEGIGHQLVIEEGLAAPSSLMLGASSCPA
jgi:3-isopropylmalate/(R)-2-methylmalate dehydratase large subunit